MEITTVAHIIDAANSTRKDFGLEDVWWRGQARLEGWPLRPKAHREGGTLRREGQMIRRFRQRAPSRVTHALDQADLVSWLFLAQHYGLPTRLLDWTENSLIAAFFVVCDEEHVREPGVLFAFDPGRANKEVTGRPGILPASRGEVFPLFQQPFQDRKPDSDKILAVLATEVDLRMMLQRSAFTIHGANAPALEDAHGAKEFLRRFEIPARAKSDLRKELARLGVTWSTVFPDLEHLARELKEMTFVRGDQVDDQQD